MDGPSRSGGFRQSRRSRSQRDRERRRRRADLTEHRPSSPSSASDQELCRGDSLLGASGAECRPGFPGARHRPPRRRKRESVSCEEDIIDGFAIASFISLEALEMDCSLKPPERSGLLTDRGIKRKRPLDENGGPPATYTNSWEPRRKIKSKQQRKREAKIAVNHMETGYICDTESESGDKASDIMEPAFIICTREVVNFNSSSSTAANGCPLMLANRTQPLLSVTPRVSGLERSQERSMEQPYPESSATSSLPNLDGHSVASVSLEHRNGTSGRHHHHDSSPLQHKHKPFLGKSQSIFSINGNSRTSGKPSSSSSSSSIKPPTPATSVSLARGPGGIGTVRPSSRPSPGAVFTPSPSLPPPPRLVQVSPHPSTGGPSVSSSNSGTSSRSSQGQASIPPMAYQFHQHNHQHQHTHTHQHFLHPTAAPPPLFEKYPGKMEGLFRHPFFPSYPSSVPGIPPVLPPNGPFSSLQGAFQPKGAAPEMTAGLGVVPPHLQPKASRLTDPFAPPPKVSNKPGKWCAMHVRVAWLILRHQDKVKLLQADPQKLDFRNDLLPRLPGPGIGGLGGLGPLGGPLPPNHDLSRPGLFAAAGGVNPSSTPFMPPSTPHSSFLSPAAHLDPYVRSPPFSSLGALGSGAFGGLGSPTIAPSVFGHKTEPSGSAVGGLGNPHDPWNRLHGAPASFPSGSSWAKGPEKRDDRGKDMERREVTHIKDEKDRDSHSYGRSSVRISPGVPSLKHRSGTPSSHMNGLISLSGGGVHSDSQSRERERDSDKRQHSASKSSASSTAPDRPRSSTSSILTTSPGVPVASSPLDLFHRQQAHTLSTDSNHSTQRENNASSSSLIPVKKPDRTTTPLQSKPSHGIPPGLLIPPVKVKEERKEEPDPVPISLHPVVPPHGFERPSSRHPHHPSTPSSTLSLTPTPAMPLPPPTPHPPHHALSLLDRTRAMDAYLVGAGGSAGLVLGAPPDRFPPHPHAPQGHAQPTHSFPWDPWRDLAAHHHQQQQQQQQQRREILTLRADPHLALRSDPHLSRLLQHQRYLEAERAAVVAAVANGPHHPPVPTSSASSAANRPEFGLMSHPFDEEHRAQILREDYERARYFGMHPHLSAPHLPSPSHAAHLEQLHAGLLSHPHLHPTGASSQPQHHPGLFSRLGPLHAHSHMPNGLLTKAPGLVGALSVGAPPPLIPSVSRSSTPPRGPRLGAGDLSIFSAHKDAESR